MKNTIAATLTQLERIGVTVEFKNAEKDIYRALRVLRRIRVRAVTAIPLQEAHWPER